MELNNLRNFNLTIPPRIQVGEDSRLVRWANSIAAHYYGPVCLVGSACLSSEYRDVDILVIIEDDDFDFRYGLPEHWEQEGKSGIYKETRWAWAKDCAKKWRHGCTETRLFLDFKVIPKSHYLANWVNAPIWRLDSSPFFQTSTDSQ